MLQFMLAITVIFVVTVMHPCLSTLRMFIKTTQGLLFIVISVEGPSGSGTPYKSIISETTQVCTYVYYPKVKNYYCEWFALYSFIILYCIYHSTPSLVLQFLHMYVTRNGALTNT